MSLTRIIIFAVLFLIDLYVFQAVKLVSSDLGSTIKNIIYGFYWSMTALSLGALLVNSFYDFHLWNRRIATYSFALIVGTYIFKIIVVLFLLIDDIIRLVRYIFSLFQKKAVAGNLTPAIEGTGITRLEFLSKMGLIVAAVPFFSLIYGMIRGPYRFQVRKEKIILPKLPDAFAGLRILQISDIHSGSFLTTHPMQDLVNLVNKQNADIVFFTGDLVNDLNSEMNNFKTILNQIKAPMGVYSILGNHDYGDYMKWESEEAKVTNLNALKQTHKDLGWRLLLNEHVLLERGREKIGLIGVANWSSVMRHNKHGDLPKSIKGMPDLPVKILLSHDPSHWHHEVSVNYKDIDLTLSGHTHGMQFGVEIPGFKWSPVQYVYKEWAGLYKKNSQYIYVNRGAGFIGYPGRVGIMPEITILELAKA